MLDSSMFQYVEANGLLTVSFRQPRVTNTHRIN